MSAIEKLFIQIFEKKKRIIDQAHRRCQLFDQHLVSKLLIDGIVPPPWLSNPMLASLTSDPKDLNEDDLIFGALFSRAQSTIPISDCGRSMQGNAVVTTDNGQPQSGLHSEFHALNRDNDAGDGLSNLPDCSVNNVGRSSFDAPEMDSTAISPQIQMESRISHSHNDPAFSLAKLQRSKSRQRALELRHSAKAAKSCLGVDNDTGVGASGKIGSATTSPQLDHFEGSEIAKVYNTNIQSCAAEEVERSECLTQRSDQSNYSGRVTRSRSLALKLNSSNVASSSKVKEDGPESNYVIKRLEPVDAPCFSNGSCEAKETNKGDYQRRETEDNAFSKRVTRSRSTRQAKCDNELLKLESASAGGNGVEPQASMQPVVNGGPTFFSKTCDDENDCQRKATKDGDYSSDEQASNVKIRRLHGSFFQSSNDDALMHGGSIKSIVKSTQSPQPSVSKHSQPLAMPVVGSFHRQKDPDLCAVNVKTNEGKSKSVGNTFVDKSPKCSQSAVFNSYHELEGTQIAAGRSSSSEKDCKLDTEVAAAASCGNTRDATTSTTEGSLRPVNSSNLDSRISGRRHSTLKKSLLEKSFHAETVVAGKSLNARENIISGANITHNIDDRSAGTVAKIAVEFDVLVDKHNACLGSSPKVGLDVSVPRPPPSNIVMSVKPKQLDFDTVEESSMNRIPSADPKARGQGVSPDKGTLTMEEPECLDDKLTSLVCQEKCNFSMKFFESYFEETDAVRKPGNVMSSKSQSSVVQKELCPRTSIGSLKLRSSTNRLIPSQTACQSSSGGFPKEMASKLVLENIYVGGDECGSRIIEDTCSTAVTDSHPLENAVPTVTDRAVGSAAAMDESNIYLTNPDASSGICIHQNNSLSRGKWSNDEKDAGFSRKLQIPKNSTGSFALDMDHSCPQHKRGKIESQAERYLTASRSLLEKQHESSNPWLVSGNSDIKENNREASTEVQYLTSHQGDVENSPVSCRTAEEMQNTEGYHIMEGSSLEVKSDQKFNLDGRDRSGNTLLCFTSSGLGESFAPCLTEQGSSNSCNCLTAEKVVTNSCSFGIGSSKHCTIDKNLDAEGSSSGRIYLGETAMLLKGSFVSQGIQRSDPIGTDETAPEIESFVIQPDEAEPCTDGDHIGLENLNFSSDSDEYASILERLNSSTFVNSPFCSSSNPYRFHKIPDIHQSLPNGLVEGMMGMRTSLLVNGESGKSFSDCLTNCKNQSTWEIKKACVSPIQTLWDRIKSKYGSSGKRESSKPELPCIDEENEAADEISNTFQNRILTEGTTGSIIREPLAEFTDNAKPSLVSQDDILDDGCGLDSVAREFSFCGTQKLEKGSAGRRRFTGKGKENQRISRGTNNARRTTESLRNRSSRPKLSGKSSMNKGPTYPGGKSSCSNIVSNITSFIPLIQQKQAAEVITGKRDIKVKALEAAEAAKRMAEKKENERKMKKEALKLERERIEQDNRRQLELQNRKKEEERKKREAEQAAKKRQREEEERIEKERKRKRVEEAKQREEEERLEKERKRKRIEEAKRKHQEREKICAKKEEKGTKCCDAVDGKNESKECIDGREKCKNLENNREGNMKIPLAETFTSKNPMTDETKESLKHSEDVNDCNKEKIIGNPIKGTENDDLISQNKIEEQSYDISPYKGSDDEDDDDSRDNNKFLPSWASKKRLYLAVSSQKLVDPETIFPLQSFCNISEVLLARKLQGKQ